MWGLLLVLGQNELFAGMSSPPPQYPRQLLTILFLVARNPFLILLLILLGTGAYVTYTLNLWGPIIQMTTAASEQGITIAKQKLREWLVETETGRQALAMSANTTAGQSIGLDRLDAGGKRQAGAEEEEDVEI